VDVETPPDWAKLMGGDGVLLIFLVFGALILFVVYVLSIIDKPRDPPGPDKHNCDSPPLSDSGEALTYAARTGAYSVSNSLGLL
jgi:hypothetical protein